MVEVSFHIVKPSQWLKVNTLWAFCKIYAQGKVFFRRGGGGVNFNIALILYFHFAIKFQFLLSICGLHFWCPLNLKMLPTPLVLTPMSISLWISYDVCHRVAVKLHSVTSVIHLIRMEDIAMHESQVSFSE